MYRKQLSVKSDDACDIQKEANCDMGTFRKLKNGFMLTFCIGQAL